MDKLKFEQLVNESIDSLPVRLRDAIGNVAIVIEEYPRTNNINESQIKRGSTLLGLYEGIPQDRWGRQESGLLPDKITIFQKTIEEFAADEANLKELVRDVVWHEIGHHFGFGEDKIREIEARRSKSKLKKQK